MESSVEVDLTLVKFVGPELAKTVYAFLKTDVIFSALIVDNETKFVLVDIPGKPIFDRDNWFIELSPVDIAQYRMENESI